MEITCSVTDNFDVKIDFYEGPLMASAILSLEDETQVIVMLQNTFRDARAIQAGFSREDVDKMNRERAGAKED